MTHLIDPLRGDGRLSPRPSKRKAMAIAACSQCGQLLKFGRSNPGRVQSISGDERRSATRKTKVWDRTRPTTTKGWETLHMLFRDQVASSRFIDL